MPGFRVARLSISIFKIRRKWICGQEDIFGLLKMVESGIIGLGEEAGMETVGVFGLEEWEKAFYVAVKNAGMGQYVVFRQLVVGILIEQDSGSDSEIRG